MLYLSMPVCWKMTILMNCYKKFADNLKRKIPSYEWFLNAFKNVGWSNHYDLYRGERNKTRVQIILEVIEMFVSQSHNAQ